MLTRVLFLLSLGTVLAACQPDRETDAQLQAIVSDLSDQSGVLGQSFLYLSDGQNLVQRACLLDAPRGLADCPQQRGSLPLRDFQAKLLADIELSRTRLASSLSLMTADQDKLRSSLAALEQQLASLREEALRLDGEMEAIAPKTGNDAVLWLGLKLSIEDLARRELALKSAQNASEAASISAGIDSLKQHIAQTQALLSAQQPALAALLQKRDDIKVTLKTLEASAGDARAKLSALETKITGARAQAALVERESSFLAPALEQLQQGLIFDARAGSTALDPAEKQLVSRFFKFFPAACAQRPVDSLKELLVVEAPVLSSAEAQVGGSWHFGEIVRQLLGGNPSPLEAELFIAQWLQHWQREVALSNGDRAQPRPAAFSIFSAWKEASRRRGVSGIDLRLAPFRLIGISNRLDLRDPLRAGDAGEARLIYALLPSPTERPQDLSVAPLQFTLILEFKIKLPSDAALGRWAQQWHQLGALPCRSGQDCSAYVAQLARTTRLFTHRSDPAFVDGALAQVRSNEIVFGSPWELREFQLLPANAGAANRLVQVDAKQTPRASANGSAELNNFVASLSLGDLLNHRYELPLQLRGAKAHVRGTFPEWQVFTDPQRQNLFNRNTCNGCHSTAASVIDGFYHISPLRGFGPAALSAHLTREELPRRAAVMASFLSPASCVAGTPFDARLSFDSPRMLAQPVH